MNRTKNARILAMGIVFVTVLGVLPLVVADDNFTNPSVSINVEPSGYPTEFSPNQFWFVPGDSIEITLDAWLDTPDGIDDIYDIIVFPSGETAWTDRVKIFDDVAIDENGDATVVIEGSTTEDLKDGYYDVYVGPSDWIQNQGFDGMPGADYDSDWFKIQLYQIQASTDRLGYIPGDQVTVFYSVISIKDGSLITEEAYPTLEFDDREWAVWSQDGETREEDQLTQSSGSFNFKIESTGSAADPYMVKIWFNATWGAQRVDEITLWANPGSFRIRDLGLNVRTDRGVYQIGSVVKVTVDTFVVGAPPYVPEPGVKVDIEVMEGTGTDAQKITGYGGTFYSDASGKVIYAFSVKEGDFEEDKTYTVRVSVEKSLKEDTEDETFDVEAGGRAISVNMVFDKDVYTTGDDVEVRVDTAVPEGANDELTYLFRVIGPDGGTKAQEVKKSPQNVFTYSIPIDFEGDLTFETTVANADGDSGSDTEVKTVHYAVLLLNAEPERYEAGETIVANYELITRLLTSPSFFYEIRDAADGIVTEGEIESSDLTGTFEYTVPDVPSSSYHFFIYANLVYEDQGIWVTSDDWCYLKSGYDIEISVDNPAYSPGEKVGIHYHIRAKGEEGLPDKYVLSYGMSNGPWYSGQSSEPSGTVYYEIPSGVNQGDVAFFVYAYDGEGNYLGFASEMLTVKSSPNPLEYTRVGDVPLMGIILLILVIILILIMLFRRPSAPAPAKPAEERVEAPPPEEEAPPVAAPAEPSPLTINCKSCGAEIDITTSKRPIEVMCPNCGETEMVE